MNLITRKFLFLGNNVFSGDHQVFYLGQKALFEKGLINYLDCCKTRQNKVVDDNRNEIQNLDNLEIKPRAALTNPVHTDQVMYSTILIRLNRLEELIKPQEKQKLPPS